jgi:hypothetical protein
MADASLGQDDIDKLLNELGANDAPAPAQAAAPPSVPTPPAVAPTEAASAAPSASGSATGESSVGMGTEAIEALVNRAQEVVAGTAAISAPTAPQSGQLDQNEIDKLLADLNPQTRKRAAASSASGHLSQDDIEKLLTELDVNSGSRGQDSEVASAAKAQSGPATTGQSSKTAMASSKPAAPAAVAPTPVAAPAAASSSASSEGPLSQDDIDKMLQELGANTPSIGAAKKIESPAPAPVEAAAEPVRRTIPRAPEPVVAAPSADVTQALSPEEIDRIVAKQSTDGPPGHESEAVIDQADIDALVKQLAQATGSPEADAVAEAIAGKAADIDRLQADAAAASPEMTRDAVDVNSVLGKTASTATLMPAQTVTLNVATISTGEWRYARVLLVAAVLMLGISCGGLVFLAMSVHRLAGQLEAEHAVENPAVSGYSDLLRLALAKLGESDEAERARGIRWMDDLKRQHPERAGDVGIALARHFRSREAWKRAADEYAAAVEASDGGDDPRVFLEFADCLARLGDDAGAIRQVYKLLASEDRWTSSASATGAQAEDAGRNRQTIADAYLFLGRLLARGRDGVAVADRGQAPHSIGAAHDAPAEGKAEPVQAAPPAHPAAPAHGGSH